MPTDDIDKRARIIALNHIRTAVEAGYSEGKIRSTMYSATTEAGDVKVGGIVKGRYYADKVIVRRVGGIRCCKSFNLHTLYMECNPDQASIFDINPGETS